jgi:alpha-1,6-mannosyltransferase
VKITLTYLFYAFLLIALGYGAERENFGLLFFLFSGSWVCYTLLLKEKINFYQGISGAIALRLSLLFVFPNLSDDFYRYFFDGHLLKNCINPYLSLPVDSIDLVSDSPVQILFNSMNSPEYFSVYPPLHQLFFWLSVRLSENLLVNLVVLRIIVIGFDLLNIFLLRALVIKFHLSINRVWLYALNPLVIIELTGNLHLEGIVLTGLLFALLGLTQNQQKRAAAGWVWAVGMKLTPMIIGPLIFRFMQRKKSGMFWFLTILLTVICLGPLFLNQNAGFWNSLALYRNTFEFNASVYYLIKLPLSYLLGYNPISTLVPVLNLLTLIFIVWISWKYSIQRTSLIGGIVLIYLIFLIFQPIIHPWYLIPAFGISVLSRSRVLLIWTFTVFLSYSAYASVPVTEKWYFILIEYALVFLILWKETQGGIQKKYGLKSQHLKIL